MKIVLTGVLTAAAIIWVVVVMTPSPDEVTSQDSYPAPDDGLPLAPSLAPKRLPTTLDLPKVRLVKETRALQAGNNRAIHKWNLLWEPSLTKNFATKDRMNLLLVIGIVPNQATKAPCRLQSTMKIG